MRTASAIVLTALAALAALTACDSSPPPSPSYSASPETGTANIKGEHSPQSDEHRLQLERFVASRMTGPDGVYTNLRDTGQAAEAASGHETLSESAGLLMRYYALTGQREAFDGVWSVARRTLDMADGFSYRYSPLLNKTYTVNAAIDDLRIVRALYEAAKAFGRQSNDYKQAADRYGERFLAHNARDGRLYDMYDETYRQTNGFLTLCYADLRTLSWLPKSASWPDGAEDRLLRIVRGGYLTDRFPFYETSYDYGTGKYGDRNGEIVTVESLLTVLALAEVGEQEPASIRYLKAHVADGTLYGRYDRDGQPVTDIQSTAAYAIAAMIGSELGDRQLYESGIRRMEQYRIQDADSPYFGGYGDAATEQFYSFDNLTALLAYVY